MGKYTVRGQKPKAPRNPITSLKNGIMMAKTVIITTNTVLQINLIMFSETGKDLELIMVISLRKIFMFGHFLMTVASTAANTGWLNTCLHEHKLELQLICRSRNIVALAENGEPGMHLVDEQLYRCWRCQSTRKAHRTQNQ